MPKILLMLTTRGDDIPVKLFEGEHADRDCRDFINIYPPQHPRHSVGVVRTACEVFASTIMDSDAFGYRVTLIGDDGCPIKDRHVGISEAMYDYVDAFEPDEPIDVLSPLFPAEPQPVILPFLGVVNEEPVTTPYEAGAVPDYQEEWDTSGGGPVS